MAVACVVAAVFSSAVNRSATSADVAALPSRTRGTGSDRDGGGGPLAAGDNEWRNAFPSAPVPEARWGHATTYDLESDRVVLFGGQVLSGPMSDETWAFDSRTNRWTNLNPSPRPSIREGAGMTYDMESDRVVLFGGGNHFTAVYTDETWAYDYNSNTWTNKAPSVRPSVRYDMPMAYDSESDRVILFGGAAASRNNETWAYDLNTNTWTNMNPSSSPSPRQAAGMAYDARADRVVLFGGAPGPLGDTWTYDFNTNRWANMNPASPPPARWGTRIAYDRHANRSVLFGGWSGVYDNDTWAYEFNTNTWTNLNPAGTPGRLEAPSIAFASCSNRVIEFGGFRGASAPVVFSNETWRYRYAAVVPTLETRPATMDFGTVVRGWSGASLLEVRNSGSGTLCFQAASSAPWMAVTPSGGNGMGEWDGITVSVDTTGLTAGVHSAVVALSSNAGSADISVTVTVNRPPALSATGEANYVADGLHPEIGYPATTFAYRVNYTDPDNDPPAAGNPRVDIRKAGVPLPGSPFAMTEIDPSDADYSNGKLYAFNTMLAAYGTDYTYQFQAADAVGNPATDWPNPPADSPDVVNRGPVLSWVGVAPYASDGLDVESGGLDSTFVFRVVYTDADNESARGGVLLHVVKGVASIPGSPFLMVDANVSDTTFADGKEYMRALVLPFRGNDYRYSFTASDGVDVATGAPTAFLDAPDVRNRVPTMTFPTGAYADGVEPDRGIRGSRFTFGILYRDDDNDAPSAVELVLEKGGVAYGLPLAMNANAWVALPGDYVAGRAYSVVVTLPDEGSDYVLRFRTRDAYDPTQSVDSPPRDAPDVDPAPAPPALAPEPNWKPLVAGMFAAVLLIAALATAGGPGSRSSAGIRAARKTLLFTSLPFIALELSTGVVSFVTGYLSIPPMIGPGTLVDAAILVAGIFVIVFRSRRKSTEQV